MKSNYLWVLAAFWAIMILFFTSACADMASPLAPTRPLTVETTCYRMQDVAGLPTAVVADCSTFTKSVRP